STVAQVPGHYLDLTRQSNRLDYADLVQIASALNRGQALCELPAFKQLGQPLPLLDEHELLAARQMFR
ncbi:MAG: histidine kinase, partial [Pseudomonas sp.]|nr:histidine kinase [Pseudomonas sp.]